jgi:hypothetical protein
LIVSSRGACLAPSEPGRLALGDLLVELLVRPRHCAAATVGIAPPCRLSGRWRRRWPRGGPGNERRIQRQVRPHQHGGRSASPILRLFPADFAAATGGDSESYDRSIQFAYGWGRENGFVVPEYGVPPVDDGITLESDDASFAAVVALALAADRDVGWIAHLMSCGFRCRKHGSHL